MQRATFLRSFSRKRVFSLPCFKVHSFGIHYSTTLLKESVKKSSSFSAAKWNKIATELNLSDPLDDSELPKFAPPMCELPLSFHRKVGLSAWEAQDVYRERSDQSMEEGRVRILEPYLVPATALFRGRVIDKPQEKMKATQYSSGGKVEHELLMIGGALFLVIEVTMALMHNFLPQLFLELFSAAQRNKARFPDLRVYGLLTDLSKFNFYSYHPKNKRFYFDTSILTNNRRDDYFIDMIGVTNKVFSVMMYGFMQAVRAYAQKGRTESPSGDLPHAQVALAKPELSSPKLLPVGSDEPTDWDAVLKILEESYAKFQRAATSDEDHDKFALEAVELLNEGVQLIPRMSRFTGKAEPSTPAQLEHLIHQFVDSWSHARRQKL